MINKLIEFYRVKYNRARGIPYYPLYMNIAVTFLCNLKCRMCGIWSIYKTGTHNPSEELSVEDFKKGFSDPLFNYLRRVNITGGEPFLREDLKDVILAITQDRPVDSLIFVTNGYSPDIIEKRLVQILKEVTDREINISVSLDGLGDVHDRIRGTRGSFERVKETLNRLKILKNSYGNFKNIGISFTISEDNYACINEVKMFAASQSIGFGCRLAQESGFYQNMDSLNYLKNRDEIKKVVKALYAAGKSDFLKYQMKYIENQSQPVPCYSSFVSCFLDPYGNVFPCIMMMDKAAGNIREDKFSGIWNSSVMREYREVIKKKECSCWTECEAMQSMYYSGSLIDMVKKKIKKYIRH